MYERLSLVSSKYLKEYFKNYSLKMAVDQVAISVSDRNAYVTLSNDISSRLMFNSQRDTV